MRDPSLCTSLSQCVCMSNQCVLTCGTRALFCGGALGVSGLLFGGVDHFSSTVHVLVGIFRREEFQTE